MFKKIFLTGIFINIGFLFAQRFETIAVYDFVDKNTISQDFKKEFELYFEFNPNSENAFLSFNNDSCNDNKFNCPILYDPHSDKFLKGIINYKDKKIYIYSKISDECTINLYFKKIKDTTVNISTLLYQSLNYNDENDTIVFDDSGIFFYWTNLIVDTILIKIPTTFTYTEYINISSKRFSRIDNKNKKINTLKPLTINTNLETAITKKIYFVFEVNKGEIVYLATLLAEKNSENDNIMSEIIKKSMKSKKLKKLKNGIYISKAQVFPNRIIIDYTFLIYIFF